ncbi:MAG: hypothetical protein AB1422_06410 [bacterium]
MPELNNDTIKIIQDLRSTWEIFYDNFIKKLFDFITQENDKIFFQYGRKAYWIDIENKNRLKSSSSIVEKINKTIKKKPSASNLKGFIEDCILKLDDIARCRILCNYNSDMEKIDEKLKNKSDFDPVPFEYCEDKRKDKRIEAGLSFEKGAHRAIHEYFKMKRDEKVYYLEVQIMTSLQEAWDIKQHIIYEEIRKNVNHPEIKSIQDRFHALSGLLMIADEFADKTWKKYIKEQNQHENL